MIGDAANTRKDSRLEVAVAVLAVLVGFLTLVAAIAAGLGILEVRRWSRFREAAQSDVEFIQEFRSSLAAYLEESNRHLQKQFWGRHLWARGYFVASSGNVTDEAIMAYIKQQDGTEPDDGGDDFQVTKS